MPLLNFTFYGTLFSAASVFLISSLFCSVCAKQHRPHIVVPHEQNVSVPKIHYTHFPESGETFP